MIVFDMGLEQDAVFYRVITPAYASTPLSGMGAARQGGRFNRPGQEALYLSSNETTALAEYRQDNPWLRPRNDLHVLYQEVACGGLARRL